jgi:alpha-galactosidase
MKKLTFSILCLGLMLHSCTQKVKSNDPDYYLKKGTWYETVLASREALTVQEKKAATRNTVELGEWSGIGPFKAEGKNLFAEAFAPEKEIDLGASYGGGKLKWEKHPDWKDSAINYFKPELNSVQYVYRVVSAKKDTTITAYLGSDDGIKVWVNGHMVLEHEINRACEPNQEVVKIDLKAGDNPYLMKICNGMGDFAFYFSLINKDPVKILWTLTERDFPGDAIGTEMNWERQDSIWTKAWIPGDYSELAGRYAHGYLLSCENRDVQPEDVKTDIKNISQLKAVRTVYLASRNNEKIILTPKPGPAPKINGPEVYGVRPGHPFQYTIPVTGDRPMAYDAMNLPRGLTVDKTTGHITGLVDKEGTFEVVLTAKNSAGSAEKKFKIIVGDQIALTPPLGWNSWNCFATAVDDQKVRAAADAMVNSGLIDHGWSYINIDDCWEIKPDTDDPLLMGEPRKPDGSINTNKKFPDMKALCDYVHSKGLKIGIYSSPGPTTCGGYIASYQYEEQDARQYATWGIDYLKYDWCSYTTVARDASLPELVKPYQVMREALNKVDRDIIFSLCQYGMGNVWEWGAQVGGNCWRTTGDITDTWQSLSSIGFSQDGHEKYAAPGHWNDPDMLIVGWVGWGPKLHPTGLSPNEQYTHISLWALLSSPLLIGCDMTRFDDFTLNLLTNDEVLAINQDPLGQPAGRIKKDGNLEIWSRNLADGSKAVGLFNLGNRRTGITVKWADLGIAGKNVVRDVWRQKDIATADQEFTASVARHGVVLVKIVQTK